MQDLNRFRDDLRKAGKRNPQLLTQKLESLDLSDLELAIMKYRYVDGLLIKQIPDLVLKSDAWVKRVHQKATIKLLDKLKASDLLELGVSLDYTSRLLYKVRFCS